MIKLTTRIILIKSDYAMTTTMEQTLLITYLQNKNNEILTKVIQLLMYKKINILNILTLIRSTYRHFR